MRSRRSFLKSALAAPFVSRMFRVSARSMDFDPGFGTASHAVRAIRQGVISSRELTEVVYKRIRKFNPKVNAFITLVEEQALARARQADDALARGQIWGRLHGLPILIKDCFATAAVRTTAGSKRLQNHAPTEDAVAVARLKSAGAIFLGKTNVPEFAGDLQSYNEIAGTTNNPWNPARTPGGSTGGGAAALAAGFGFLELGSDIGGSIRTPCHFCGIYGHKPTLKSVPVEGHIPPLPGELTAIVDLNVAGPMARSAEDLQLELEIIAGPDPAEARAYNWSLPAARQSRLKDYRLGFVLDDPFCRLSSEVAPVLASLVEKLRKEGVQLNEGWPAGVRPQEQLDTYMFLLSAAFSSTFSKEDMALFRKSRNSHWGYYARIWLQGSGSSHSSWLAESAKRLRARALWRDYFKSHDAFLMPANFVPAFPHDHELNFFQRSVATPEGARLYGDMLRWISFATLSGCPATAAPAGRTRDGLPVGIQILGPYQEDATPIDVARRLAEVVGGFEEPAGFK